MRPLLITILFIPLLSLSQPKVPERDSLIVVNAIGNFYSWYGHLVKTGRVNQELNPVFVRGENGMTALDFTNHRAALKAHGFSNRLIDGSVHFYRHCDRNLKNIPFDEFSKFSDLDDFESIGCDFGNRYQWYDEMEPVDTVVVSRLRAFDGRMISAYLHYKYGSSISKSAIVTLILDGERSVIDNLYFVYAEQLSNNNPALRSLIEQYHSDELYFHITSGINTLKKIMATDTSFAVKQFVYNNLAEMYHNDNDYRTALSYANLAIQNSNTDGHSYYLKHRAQISLDDYKGALETMNTAIALNPTNAMHYLNRAFVHKYLKKKKLTRKDLLKCEQLARSQNAYGILELIELDLLKL